MWARPELSRRDRSLIVVSVLCAQARDVELELHTGVASATGSPAPRSRRSSSPWPPTPAIRRHGGQPDLDAALRQAEGVEQLSERSAPASKSDAERDRDAAEVYRAVSGGRGGDDPEKDLRFLTDRLGGGAARLPLGLRRGVGPARAGPARPVAFGDRHLTPPGAENELAVHIPTGIRNGLTPEEIEAAITHLALDRGFPRAVEAIRVAKAAFADLGR